MDKSADNEKKKDRETAGFEILRKDEQFWQRAVKVLSKIEISESLQEENAENDNKQVVKHTEKVFNILCKCSRCIVFRQCLTGVYVENCAYNQLWSKLQEIIRSYYSLLPPEHEDIFNRTYQKLLKESCGIRWFSDGSIDVKKNLHVSMGSYFSISNEMTFMIVFNMLYARDRHQLFELLCLQLTSIILAYREGIKEITKCVDGDDEYYKPEEFLNYILNGYERISEISETQTPLVIEMRDHLQKFSLTWQLMNQCMYYRFLYVDIESRMADCILRLKDTVDVETYKNFVYRFIKFDEEMTAIGQVWEVALVALELYRNSTPEQVTRIERINLLRQIFQSLKSMESIEENDGKPLGDHSIQLDWIVSSEKDEVWQSVLSSIKKELASISHKGNCKCWACSITNGNSVPEICAIPDGKSNGDKKKKTTAEDCYHLAWAVFKHLKDRQPYTKPFFHPEMFCVFNDPPCTRMECQVATNLIIGSYPTSFTKFLLRTYEPLAPADREKFLKVPSQSLIRKFCRKKGGAAAKEIMQEADEINHTFLLLNMFWDDDEIADPNLRNGLASALAENFKVDVKFPQKHIIFSYFYALFRMDPNNGNDITLDLEWLEQINLGNLFKSFGAISNTITTHHHHHNHHHHHHEHSRSNSVEPIEMQLNELKITAEVSAGSNALDLVQFSMKEVADKLSSISLSDDNESAKAVIENEIKKPLVEALKLAASNKKLEAELKSLQKEHNMLKDMVKGLEQIHGENKEITVKVTTTQTTKPIDTQTTSKCNHGGHSHSHSHSHSRSSSPIPDDHGGKDDCICYYCTLFGKNQDLVTNPRSTEARDRLRKKLHQLQSQKDSTPANSATSANNSKNLKNISLLLKNNSPSPTNGNIKESKPTNAPPTPPQNGTSMKMKVELELQQRKKKTLMKPVDFTTIRKQPPEDVTIQRANDLNIRSLENLIEYIEGPTSKAAVEQKKAQEAEMKKQQKKLRAQQQKIRKQVEQQIEEMKGVNGDIQEVMIEIKQIQNQLSQLKAGKGKKQELKRIKTAEDKLSALNEHRKKIENFVKGIAEDCNTLCPDIDLVQECTGCKGILSIIAPEALIQPPPVRTQPSSIKMAPPILQHPQPQPQPPPPPPQMVKLIQPAKIQVTTPSQEEDPAKRIVTIRRVNMPHAGEPQVTVTAKGDNPEEDRLLYTFVNGQLVPASNLPPNAFQNGSIQLFNSSHKIVQEQQQKLQQQQQPVVSDKTTKKKEKVEEKKVVEKVKDKKKNDKKKEIPKKEVKETKKKEVKEEKKQEEPKVEKKKKKAYIDPEFASNPFKLLDDDGDEIADSTEEEIEELEMVPQEVEEIKKPQQSQQNTPKNDKNVQKPKQSTKNPKMERQESVASNNSKDSKQNKKQQKKIVQPESFQQNFQPQSFPLHPQYHQQPPSTQTIYKPADYVSATTKKPQQHQQQQQYAQASHPPNSIMDQLNRGVKVEGLRLPPGITLTKVTPSNDVYNVHHKRESINRIAQPMQDYNQQHHRMDEHNIIYSQGRDPNGIIMVESNPRSAYKQQQAESAATTSNGKKKNKKKNKNKIGGGDDASSKSNQMQSMGGSAGGGERMVTLKNPMFYNNNNNTPNNNASNSETMMSMMRNLQTPPFVSPMDQPPQPQQASIIKNENGMYTIRNPAFSAFGSTPSGSGSAYGNGLMGSSFVTHSNYAPSNNNTMGNSSSYPYESEFNQPNIETPKCNSVIGSEMKTVLQRRKEQEYMAQYSHFGGMNFNGASTDEFASVPPRSSSRGSGCYPSYPSPTMSNYDDLRLQPGKMLNSEVTIHNVTESKFFQNQKTQAPIGTPRMSSDSLGTSSSGGPKLFGDLLVQQTLVSRPHAPPPEYNGNEGIFGSTLARKSIDIDSEERDIEMFKQFDMNYVPPKQKMKCNINMNEIVVNPKKTQLTHAMGEDFDGRKQASSTNSNSPSSLASSSMDELYEKAYYEKSSGTSSLFSSNGM